MIAAYDGAAAELAQSYDAVGGAAGLQSVQALFPTGGLALDVGAGSGRDARWLTSLGFEVAAVEPATGLRNHGASTSSATVRWIDDRLPALDRVHRLALSFDLIILSAVWQHIAPDDRPRAFRKLATLLRAGGVLALTLRSGPAPADRPMHPTSSGEIEGLARAHGMEVLKVEASDDLLNRSDVSWTTIALRMPDDGTGALPLVRGIVLGDEKSSTYKLGILRAVARIAEQAPSAAVASPGQVDAVDLPLGLVALFWIRMYLPVVRLAIPQAPKNLGADGLGFAKAGFRRLLADGVDPSELRIGAVFEADRAAALHAAISEAVSTIATMPANFTRFPNSDQRVFEAKRDRAGRGRGESVTLPLLRAWGTISLPGHLWRALSRFGPWIEPMLMSEWARLSRSYSERMGVVLAPGVVEAALAWREPVRTTSLARLAAERMSADGYPLECVWTGRTLISAKLDVDHCLPWAAWPCGDLWNLAPCDPRVNRHEKRDKLPSAAMFADSKDRIIRWWDHAYLADRALGERFVREAAAALPILEGSGTSEIYSALDWRRMRLLQDQQVPEWTRAQPA